MSVERVERKDGAVVWRVRWLPGRPQLPTVTGCSCSPGDPAQESKREAA